MSDEIVIRADKIYKDFVLPTEKISTLKGQFTNIMSLSSRTNEQQHALRDISFEVKKGEFFGIVGRNGSGKSTLLKILAGIYQPTKGTVQTIGRVVPFIELGVGFNPELTGRENVYLNGAILGFSRREIDDMYKDIVAFAELEKFMDQKLKNYSSGMQVRLAFSMATRSEADILIVDEVLAVGDADFQRKCFDYFRKLKRDQKTVIFVSHDMSAVREYCDRAIMIEKSHLVLESKPDIVAREYSKLFLKEDDKSLSDSDKRWGEGSVKYTNVSVQPRKAGPDGTIQISTTAKAVRAIERPIYGFSVKNASGQQILGTNTRILLQTTKSLKPNEEYSLTWTIPNVFADGTYYVNIAVGKADGITNSDWWEEATTFTVQREERTPYVVNPAMRVEVK